MLITPSILAYAHARHHDLQREADHERLLRAALAALRACCGDVADQACCTLGCCDERGCCVEDADCARASACRARDAACRPAWGPDAGGFAALLLRTARSVWPADATRCAVTCAAA